MTKIENFLTPKMQSWLINRIRNEVIFYKLDSVFGMYGRLYNPTTGVFTDFEDSSEEEALSTSGEVPGWLSVIAMTAKEAAHGKGCTDLFDTAFVQWHSEGSNPALNLLNLSTESVAVALGGNLTVTAGPDSNTIDGGELLCFSANKGPVTLQDFKFSGHDAIETKKPGVLSVQLFSSYEDFPRKEEEPVNLLVTDEI